MNEIAAAVLKIRLRSVDREIGWSRNRLSELTLDTNDEGKKMDRLTTERRAIQDALGGS